MSDNSLCEHKKMFTDMKSAIDASRHFSSLFNMPQTAYHCPLCKNYHLTTKKSKKAKLHKWRKK